MFRFAQRLELIHRRADAVGLFNLETGIGWRDQQHRADESAERSDSGPQGRARNRWLVLCRLAVLAGKNVELLWVVRDAVGHGFIVKRPQTIHK